MKKAILKRMADADNRQETAQNAEGADKFSLAKRHSSPVISNVGRALSHLNEESIISLDPNKVDRSPFHDRFESDAEAEQKLDALKISIREEGQKIPVLVRPHPSKPNHYQLAYGYRRWVAIKAIMAESERPETIKIKAYVRELSDRQLIEEQSVENGVRENLTWIEQAMWAVQLKEAGFTSRAICPILGMSEASVSQLFRVTSKIPADIIYGVGRAKAVGRPKWTQFAEALDSDAKVKRVRSIIGTDQFKAGDGAQRIALAMQAVNGEQNGSSGDGGEGEGREFIVQGRVFGTMKSTARGIVVTIPNKESEFADWLAERMTELIREFDTSSVR